MKTTKYLLAALLAIAASGPVLAQDAKQTVDAIANVIKQNPADLADQLKAVYKKNKKNPEVLVGIGRAFLNVKNYEEATNYANLAIKASKKYAPAFILLGDIAFMKDDGGGAAQQYQQAIYFDPKNPDAYYKYANIYRGSSPEQSAQILEELRAQRPDIAVDAMKGHLFYLSQLNDKAFEAYSKVPVAQLTDNQIVEYAMAGYLTQQRQQSIDAALAGLQRDPRKAALNRLVFYNYTDMGKTAEALDYADRLFNKSDSAVISGYDYTYAGTAHLQAKQYDQAVDMFTKAVDANKDNADLANSNRKNLSDAYLGKGEFDKAIAYYEEYLSKNSSPTAADIAGLGTVYQNMAAELKDPAKQKAAFLKADSVYAKLGEKFPANIDFANFMRARVNSNLDPETKEGLAKPYYEALANSLAAKTERDNIDKARLIESYRYLGYYHLVHNQKAAGDVYWKKILELDPENETAKQALSIK